MSPGNAFAESASGIGYIVYDKQVQNLGSVHEQNLASLRGIEAFSEPVFRLLRYFSTRHDECMVNQSLLIDVRVEDFMSEHHRYLIVNFRYIFVLGSGSGIDLSTFDLKTEVQPMSSW